MVMAVSAMAMARGLLMPMLTTAAMAMVDLDTDTERGPLMPMLTMAAMAMAVMVMVDSDTATARGPLMLTTEAMAMAALATAMVVMPMASNLIFKDKIYLQISIPDLNLFLRKLNSYHELKKLKYTQFLSTYSCAE